MSNIKYTDLCYKFADEYRKKDANARDTMNKLLELLFKRVETDIETFTEEKERKRLEEDGYTEEEIIPMLQRLISNEHIEQGMTNIDAMKKDLDMIKTSSVAALNENTDLLIYLFVISCQCVGLFDKFAVNRIAPRAITVTKSKETEINFVGDYRDYDDALHMYQGDGFFKIIDDFFNNIEIITIITPDFLGITSILEGFLEHKISFCGYAIRFQYVDGSGLWRAPVSFTKHDLGHTYALLDFCDFSEKGSEILNFYNFCKNTMAKGSIELNSVKVMLFIIMHESYLPPFCAGSSQSAINDLNIDEITRGNTIARFHDKNDLYMSLPQRIRKEYPGTEGRGGIYSTDDPDPITKYIIEECMSNFNKKYQEWIDSGKSSTKGGKRCVSKRKRKSKSRRKQRKFTKKKGWIP